MDCVGLITNDFINRAELYSWLCALFIEPSHQGFGLSKVLINHIIVLTKQLGFNQLHLCTDLIGFMKKMDLSIMA